MCGIYGVVGNVSDDPGTRLTLARALCVFNISRGHHSAGIATSGEDLKTSLYKLAIHPARFIRKKRFSELASAAYRVLIGHTRWATHGSIETKNAHPFIFGGTVGVHNGVVVNTKGMAEYTGKSFPVDSQYLVYCLDKFGHLGPAQGSLNLAYFGRKDSADLRLIRHGNPLHFAWCNHQRGFVFSSEHTALKYAMSIASLRGKVYEMEDDRSISLFIQKNGVVEWSDMEVPFLAEDAAAQYRTKQTGFFNWDSWKDTTCGGKPARESRERKSIHEMTDQEYDDLLAWEEYTKGGGE